MTDLLGLVNELKPNKPEPTQIQKIKEQIYKEYHIDRNKKMNYQKSLMNKKMSMAQQHGNYNQNQLQPQIDRFKQDYEGGFHIQTIYPAPNLPSTYVKCSRVKANNIVIAEQNQSPELVVNYKKKSFQVEYQDLSNIVEPKNYKMEVSFEETKKMSLQTDNNFIILEVQRVLFYEQLIEPDSFHTSWIPKNYPQVPSEKGQNYLITLIPLPDPTGLSFNQRKQTLDKMRSNGVSIFIDQVEFKNSKSSQQGQNAYNKQQLYIKNQYSNQPFDGSDYFNQDIRKISGSFQKGANNEDIQPVPGSTQKSQKLKIVPVQFTGKVNTIFRCPIYSCFMELNRQTALHSHLKRSHKHIADLVEIQQNGQLKLKGDAQKRAEMIIKQDRSIQQKVYDEGKARLGEFVQQTGNLNIQSQRKGKNK